MATEEQDGRQRLRRLTASGLGIGTTAFDATMPGVGQLATGGIALGAWLIQGVAQKQQEALNKAVFDTTMEAAYQLADGDAEMAKGVFDAAADNERLREAIWAAALKMRESTPCEGATSAAGVLMAHYIRCELRPDQDFRRWMGWLCDADGPELALATEIVRVIVRRPDQILTMELELVGQPLSWNLALEVATDNVRKSSKVDNLLPSHPGVKNPLSSLADHDLLVRHFNRSGGFSTGLDSLAYEYPRERIEVLAIILGVRPAKK